MVLANIKVGGSSGKKNYYDKPKRAGTSLKSIKSVRSQIQKQERIRNKLQKANDSGKESRKSLQLNIEIKKAFEKLRGRKVHDDIGMLKKAEKRLVRKKKKSVEKWESKKEELKQSQMDRQQKRKENIEKFRTGKKPVRSAEPEKPKEGKKSSLPGMSRKQRRHANLMKYGPKNTRDEREEKRKADRKERKRTVGGRSVRK
jgi:hypothetical protein